MRKHRPYSAADTLSRCLRRILIWLQQTNSRKSRCRAYRLNKLLFAQTAPPPLRGRGTGVRSRAPPVADAARRSTRSGRKERASEQREDFFGHRKAVGQIRRGYLWSASVRSTDLFFPIIEGKTIFVSSTAKRQRGLSRGNSSPLTRFCLLLAVQKEAPAGQAYSLCLCKRRRDAEGNHKLAPAG